MYGILLVHKYISPLEFFITMPNIATLTEGKEEGSKIYNCIEIEQVDFVSQLESHC